MTLTFTDRYTLQLNKAIAHELGTDKEIATYRLVCRATNNAIDADNQSFWRAKFREQYVLKEGVSNAYLQRTYQRRARLLRRGTTYDFFRGHKGREASVVEILRDLIVGKWTVKYRSASLETAFIRRIIIHTI